MADRTALLDGQATVESTRTPAQGSLGTDGPIRRDASIRAVPETVDREKRTVEVVISTGAAVRRWDWSKGREYDELLSIDPGSVRLGDGRREVAMMRWGLIPAWANDATIGSQLINARAETLAAKPSFRVGFQRRRCLVPADGFYEWKGTAAGKKQPYLIRLETRTPFAFAGLWERWEKAADGRPVETFTIVTTEANDDLRTLHDRMPVILAPDDYDAWLDAEATPAERAAALLKPFPGRLSVVAVSARVNSPRNDDPGCVAGVAVPV